MEEPPVGIRTNNVIDAKASNFEGFMYLKGGHCSVWCDIVVKRQNFKEVRVWEHINRKCCARELLGDM